MTYTNEIIMNSLSLNHFQIYESIPFMHPIHSMQSLTTFKEKLLCDIAVLIFMIICFASCGMTQCIGKRH